MENELQKTFLDTTDIPDIQTYFVNQAFEFQELMMMYSCAIREMRTKLEAVSYTHLDVYKRQGTDLSHPHFPRWTSGCHSAR